MDIEEVMKAKGIEANIGWLERNLDSVRVIYSDMDGTMLGPIGCFFRDSDFELTLRPASALLEALRREVDIMLVSGRHKSQLRESARILGLRNYIAELGTELVYDMGREVLVNLGEFHVEGESVYEAIVATGVVDFLLEHYPKRLEMHTPWSEERECTPLFRGNVDVEEARKLLEEHGYEEFYLADNGVIPRKSPTLDVSETRAYHLIPKGVSKDKAVRQDQEHRSISRDETVAVGDAEADLPFAEVVGAFFIVRNGLEANPHLADQIMDADNIFVTEGRMGIGWAEVVETILALS